MYERIMPCEPWFAPGRLTQIYYYLVRLGESVNLLRLFMCSSSGSLLYPMFNYCYKTQLQKSADVKDLQAIL